MKSFPKLLNWNTLFPMVLLSGLPFSRIHFQSVQLLSRVQLFATPWTVAQQASLSITNSWSLLKTPAPTQTPTQMSITLVMPSNHLILCHFLLLQPSIFPNVRVFSSESVLRIRWPKYWSFSFGISPSNEYSGLISFRWTGWTSLYLISLGMEAVRG